MPNPAASPAVSSTVGLKNMVIAPLTVDTEETLTYGDLQLVAGAIEASITPQNADPDVQYFDDQEGDVLYPDPELSFKTKLADLPLIIQEMIFANKIDCQWRAHPLFHRQAALFRGGLQEREGEPQVPLYLAVQGARQARDRELCHEGRQVHHPPDRRSRMDGDSPHP